MNQAHEDGRRSGLEQTWGHHTNGFWADADAEGDSQAADFAVAHDGEVAASTNIDLEVGGVEDGELTIVLPTAEHPYEK